MSRVFRFADRGIMKRATLIEGIVLIVLGMLVMGGVLLNLASNNLRGALENLHGPHVST